MGTIDEELLYAIRAMEVLLESGTGVAQVIRHMADDDYGDISSVLIEILEKTEAGQTLAEALRQAVGEARSPGFKKVLSTLMTALEDDVDITTRLDALADQEIRQRKVRVEGFVERLGGAGDRFLILAILLPILAVIIGVIGAMMGGAGPIPAFDVPSFLIPLLFCLSAFGMLAMVRTLRRGEPRV